MLVTWSFACGTGFHVSSCVCVYVFAGTTAAAVTTVSGGPLTGALCLLVVSSNCPFVIKVRGPYGKIYDAFALPSGPVLLSCL